MIHPANIRYELIKTSHGWSTRITFDLDIDTSITTGVDGQ